jgi:hypothetical protein
MKSITPAILSIFNKLFTNHTIIQRHRLRVTDRGKTDHTEHTRKLHIHFFYICAQKDSR